MFGWFLAYLPVVPISKIKQQYINIDTLILMSILKWKRILSRNQMRYIYYYMCTEVSMISYTDVPSSSSFLFFLFFFDLLSALIFLNKLLCYFLGLARLHTFRLYISTSWSKSSYIFLLYITVLEQLGIIWGDVDICETSHGTNRRFWRSHIPNKVFNEQRCCNVAANLRLCVRGWFTWVTHDGAGCR